MNSEIKTNPRVKKLTISNTEIGKGGFGTVYKGRVWFHNKPSSKQVAVKVFHYPPRNRTKCT